MGLWGAWSGLTGVVGAALMTVLELTGRLMGCGPWGNAVAVLWGCLPEDPEEWLVNST